MKKTGVGRSFSFWCALRGLVKRSGHRRRGIPPLDPDYATRRARRVPAYSFNPLSTTTKYNEADDMLRLRYFVRAEGIEPPTLVTSRRCSTTELSAQRTYYSR